MQDLWERVYPLPQMFCQQEALQCLPLTVHTRTLRRDCPV